MIEIRRSLARQFRAVLRKSVLAGVAKGMPQPVILQTNRDGLRIRAQQPTVAIEYHLPEARPIESLSIPAQAMDDFEGKKDAVVALERTAPKIVQARWEDAGVPQVKDYDAPDRDPLPEFPDLPKAFTSVDPCLMSALAEAAQVTSRQDVRYTLHHLQLRGGSGEIVATDGRQLLVQKGFTFPWKEDLLVPALAVFGCREIAANDSLSLGHTDKHVVLRAGPWTIWLTITTEGKFPRYEQIMPAVAAATTHGQIATEDAAFLERAIPSLPGAEDEDQPVTLDLADSVTVRTRASGQSRATELVLAGSSHSGKAARFVMNREFLARAMRLHFTEIHVVGADKPVLFQDEKSQFVVMPLDAKRAIKPSSDAVQIASDAAQNGQPQTTERNKTTVSNSSTPNAPGTANGATENNGVAPASNGQRRRKAKGTGLVALIDEAEALKKVLRDAYSRSHLLVRAIKRQRKQSSVMQTALRTLKELQSVEG